MKLVICVMFLLCGLSVFAVGVEKELRIQATANQSSSNLSGDSWSYNIMLDTRFVKPLKNTTVETSLKANYARADEKTTTDYLYTSFRLLGKKPSPNDGQQLLLISTTGNIGLDSVNLLVASGRRYSFANGYIEGTIGGTKELKSADPWKLDLGIEGKFRQKWGRLSAETGPRVAYDGLGGIHLNGNKVKFSADFRLDYQIGEHLGIGYSYLYNSMDSKNRISSQTIGVSYKL